MDVPGVDETFPAGRSARSTRLRKRDISSDRDRYWRVFDVHRLVKVAAAATRRECAGTDVDEIREVNAGWCPRSGS
jgi:hypothetical protein